MATEDTMSDWPKHPDGTNKKMGEMTREESRKIVAAACERLRAEIESPAMQHAITRTYLSNDDARIRVEVIDPKDFYWKPE
jgi:hypothetical protein